MDNFQFGFPFCIQLTKEVLQKNYDVNISNSKITSIVFCFQICKAWIFNGWQVLKPVMVEFTILTILIKLIDPGLLLFLLAA